MKNKNKSKCMFSRIYVYVYILFSIWFSSIIIKAEDFNLLPRSSHLFGREVPEDLTPFEHQFLSSVEQKEILNILKNLGTKSNSKPASLLQNFTSNISKIQPSSFKEVISGVSIAGDLDVIKSYVPQTLVPSECLTTVEENLKLNLLLPQISKDASLMSVVSYIFTLNQDGHITDLEKERSTGNSLLDNTVPNTLSRISPLPMPKSVPFSRQPF